MDYYNKVRMMRGQPLLVETEKDWFISGLKNRDSFAGHSHIRMDGPFTSMPYPDMPVRCMPLPTTETKFESQIEKYTPVWAW